MPRYKVIEKRCFYEGYLIDAANRVDAEEMVGDVLDTQVGESWSESHYLTELVEDDTLMWELP